MMKIATTELTVSVQCPLPAQAAWKEADEGGRSASARRRPAGACTSDQSVDGAGDPVRGSLGGGRSDRLRGVGTVGACLAGAGDADHEFVNVGTGYSGADFIPAGGGGGARSGFGVAGAADCSGDELGNATAAVAADVKRISI